MEEAKPPIPETFLSREKPEQFIQTIMMFFFKSADVYARYSKFYWAQQKLYILNHVVELKDLKDLETHLEAELNANRANLNNFPAHFCNSNINGIDGALNVVKQLIKILEKPVLEIVRR